MPHGFVQYQINECKLNIKTAKFQAITINQFLDYLKFEYPNENIELIAMNAHHVTGFLKQQEDKGQQKSTIYRKQVTLKKFFSFIYKTRQLPVDILYDYNYFEGRSLQLDKKYQGSTIDYNYPMLLEAKQKVLEHPKMNQIAKQLMVFYLHGVQLSDMFKLEIKDCTKEMDDAGNPYYAIFYTSKQGDEAAFKITAPEDIAVMDQSIEIAKERGTTFLISRKTNDKYEQSSPFLTRYYVQCINELIGFNLRSDDIRIVYVNYLYREEHKQIEEISRMLGRSEKNILKIVTQYVERLTRNDYNELTDVQLQLNL